MAPPSDRIRRILADAAPTVPPPPPRPRGDLRARLEALGLDRAPAAPEPAAWDGADDGRPLLEQVGGCERETSAGSFLYVERRLPLDAVHGRRPLESALAHAVPLRPRERGPGGARRLRPDEALFLDTETTGLAGGTGTVAFLVGTGRVEGDAFVVRQYCMRDYPEEPALLHALVEDVGDAPLVTFNGRAFDWPLLATRLSMHRMRVAPRAHLDLLPPARRLWVDSVPSHTLGALEEHVLGLRREGDLPGWRIPQAYFDFVRTGRAGLVALAFRHNELDVVSMLALMGEVGAVLAAPGRPRGASPRDLHGRARLLLDLGDVDAARRCLRAGVEQAASEDALPLRRHLGHLCRREGRVDEALEHWTALARTSPRFEAEAFEQVAKILEHRRRDFAGALEWVEEALLHVVRGSGAERDLRHREERLHRRLAAARAREAKA